MARLSAVGGRAEDEKAVRKKKSAAVSPDNASMEPAAAESKKRSKKHCSDRRPPEEEDEEEEARKKRRKKEKKKRAAQQDVEGREATEAAKASKKAKSTNSDKSKSRTDGDDAAPGEQPRSELPRLTAEEAQEYFRRNEISVEGGGRLFAPVTEFASAGFTPELLAVCDGFERPTPIQASTWPISMAGLDVVGIAETGSGKTLAFALPGLMRVRRSWRQKNGKEAGEADKGKARGGLSKPSILVVAPTRELAMQTQETCQSAGAVCGLTSVCVYGGVPKDDQRKLLRRGVDIVVATPGRLLDLMEEGACDISQVCYMVLDEADRMLDQGFEVAIRKILGATSPERQTLMFSATWPESIRKLANDFLRNPVRVTIGSEDLPASGNVTQIVEVVAPAVKEKRLLQFLKQYHGTRKNRVLVFALYKKVCHNFRGGEHRRTVVSGCNRFAWSRELEGMLHRQGWKAVAIHGDQSQAQRTQSLAGFKDGSTPLLIATDVAARGLDIPNVEYVINFTFPLTIEDYIHRIGRTGRGGKKGTAHTLFTQHDKAHAGELQNVLRGAGFDIPEELRAFGGTGEWLPETQAAALSRTLA
ncbi:MAG: putative DEAD/DEAH box RNA helicase, partial [Olpidium bornovanus]